MKRKPFWIGAMMIMMNLTQAHFQIQISTEALKSQIMKIWKIKSGMFLLLVALRIEILLLINSKDVWRQTSHALLIILEALLLFL